HAQSRRIQAPPGGAGSEDHAEEFRPRPPLSDRQPLPRSRHAAAATRQERGGAVSGREERSLRFLNDSLPHPEEPSRSEGVPKDGPHATSGATRKSGPPDLRIQ